MTIHLIGINGFKRSGKGTVAAQITALHTGHVLGVGFADKLKIMGARALGWLDLSDQECIDLMDEFKEGGVIDACVYTQTHALPTGQHITGRQYLQNFGNQARGLFGDTFWIDMVLPNLGLMEGWYQPAQTALGNMYPGVDILCITDLRYPNEAERVKALGGVVWEVVRPGLESDGHASEQPLPRDLVDLTISNDKGILDLQWEVDKALERLLDA